MTGSLRHWRIFLAAVLCVLSLPLSAQSGLYVPSLKPVKDMQRALAQPEVFFLLLQYQGQDEAFSVADLDLLDSAYGIAFNERTPMFYTMTIEGYAEGNETLAKHRADAVYRYFAMRSHAAFPLRKALNRIHSSCCGDTVETLLYEVPTSVMAYNAADLPESRRTLNKSIPLSNCVLVTFKNNIDECLGTARGCAVPAADSVIHGYYSSLRVARGAIYAEEGTKDTCPHTLRIDIEDHLDYRPLMDHYQLVPHRKQLIVMAGYVVYRSNFRRDPDECSEPQPDSIMVRVPATAEQLAAKLKFWAKVKTARGVEYKAMPTRKMPGKGQLALQAPLNITQLDTVYLGKRIEEKELSKYFYEVGNPNQAGAFAVGSRFYVAYSVDKQGRYQLKKPLRELFRIIPEQEEEEPLPADKGKGKRDGEEIIED